MRGSRPSSSNMPAFDDTMMTDPGMMEPTQPGFPVWGIVLIVVAVIVAVVVVVLVIRRKRKKAVEALSSILWGYTSQECLLILEQFYPPEEGAARK